MQNYEQCTISNVIIQLKQQIHIYRSSSSERYTYMAWKLFNNSNEKELNQKNKAVHFKQTHKVYSDRHLRQTAQRDNVQHSPQPEYSESLRHRQKVSLQLAPNRMKDSTNSRYWPETREVLILRDWQQCLQHSQGTDFHIYHRHLNLSKKI